MAGLVETTNATTRDVDGDTNPNPILSLLSKFQHFFKFPPSNSPKPQSPLLPATTTGDDDNKAVVVKLPNNRSELPSLKLEAEGPEPNTNPVVLWQVYAIGGFFILKWALARWKERSAKKDSTDDEPEEPSPSDE